MVIACSEKNEMEVSVCGDATYCVSERPCSGNGSKPDGLACPEIGAVAAKHCREDLGSYSVVVGKVIGLCIVREPTECIRLHTGAWGCAFQSQRPALQRPRRIPPTETGQGPPGTLNDAVMDLHPSNSGLQLTGCLFMTLLYSVAVYYTNF